jgi:hypothetical protein
MARFNRADKITQDRYNALAQEVNELFADLHKNQGPSSSYLVQDQIRWGWGGLPANPAVRSNKVTAELINELVHRINLSTLRTNSSDEEIVVTSPGELITAEFFNNASRLLNTARKKRNEVDPALTTIATFGRSISDGVKWNQVYETEFELDFGGYEEARHFFNAGGDIRLDYVIAHGHGTGYMTWRGIFTDMGTLKFNIDNTVSLNHRGISQSKGFVHLLNEPEEQLLYTSPAGGDGQGGYGGHGNNYSSSRLKLYGVLDDGVLRLRTELDHTNLATDVYGIVTQTGHVTHPSRVREAGVVLTIPNPTAALTKPWREKGHELPQVYATVSNDTSVTERQTITFNVRTTNVPAEYTLWWVNIGTTNGSDFDDLANSGSFTIDSKGKGQVVRKLKTDQVVEGSETVCIEIHANGINGPVIATSNIVVVSDI